MTLSADYHVEPADWKADRDALRAIRDVVFIQEQNVPIEEEWDDLDPDCQHVLARAADGTPIGTGRLTPQRTIGRMAVLADWRGRNVGAAMLQALIDRARALGWTRVSLHAQVHAIGFYERHGFQAEGEPFMEAGIEHRTMHRDLEPLEAAPGERGATVERPAYRLLQTETCSDVVESVLQLLADARHAFVVHHRDLAPGVLDHDEVLTAVRKLATSGRGADVRMLLADPAQALRDDHRLIPLVQRLPSTLHLRQPLEDEDRAYPSAFFANDNGGYLMLPQVGRFDGRGATFNLGTSHQLIAYFDEVWQRAAPATALRSLEL
ncbi:MULTISPECIES: GNAT family N-acetyltransferase [Oleiagrimonas]|uniref:GNAT family N-acetyltransferase n=1 Tax=Oleiagrimonas TaxID=1649642 RepID=UPI001F0C2C9C|nr:GNAT family N-acetyltransferase [Oleiagrimonas sp. MCCC 1A03011]